MVRALASHQCGPGSNPGVDAKGGLRLLLVLSLAPRGFSPGTPVFPSPQKPKLPNSNSIWNARTSLNEFIRTPKCFGVNKIISIYIFFYNRTSWSKFVVGRSVAWRDKKWLLRRLSNSMPNLKTLNGLAKTNWIGNKTWNQMNVTVGINRIFGLGGTFLT